MASRPPALALPCVCHLTRSFIMSLPRLPSDDHNLEPPNFFWLSELSPTELFYSFLRPHSSKSSLHSSIFGKQTPASSRPSSSRTMASKDNSVANAANVSAAPAISPLDREADRPLSEKSKTPEEQWKPGTKEWAVMLTFVISNVAVALDASILVTVLPVRPSLHLEFSQLIVLDFGHQAHWHSFRSLLDWHVIPPRIRCRPAFHSRAL